MGNKAEPINMLKKQRKRLKEELELCIDVAWLSIEKRTGERFYLAVQEVIRNVKNDYICYINSEGDDDFNAEAYLFLSGFENIADLDDMDWLHLSTLIPELFPENVQYEGIDRIDMLYFSLIWKRLQEADALLKQNDVANAEELLVQVEKWIRNEFVSADIHSPGLIKKTNADRLEHRISVSASKRENVMKRYDKSLPDSGYKYLFDIYKIIKERCDMNVKDGMTPVALCMWYVDNCYSSACKTHFESSVLKKLELKMAEFQKLNPDDLELDTYKRVFTAIERGVYDKHFVL
ncbi:hypothetical protein IHC87_06595 [Photobacterium damselae subsp. damselae]|uniref:hypothetical protein n=1 Tax=Photobacterium damselae TaxID=38293 RepID=UPI001F315B47|nr:hypothetical protein [Photobacterium damselae]UJZ95008.1 hypothetical protein IHC87_06595 [Photobacterium damselae subsp. damselae]UJZ98989.1 hypothetical protein IHC88_06585 [Photobacterium damselae subsp. damselae]